MMDRAELLKAELVAIDFWDRLYLETPEPSQIETDAARARQSPPEPASFDAHR
jgi:hypothetical protein